MIAVRRNRDEERHPFLNWDAIYSYEGDPWDALERNAENRKAFAIDFWGSLKGMDDHQRREILLEAGKLKKATYDDYLFSSIERLKQGPVDTATFLTESAKRFAKYDYSVNELTRVFYSVSKIRGRARWTGFVRVLKKEYRGRSENV